MARKRQMQLPGLFRVPRPQKLTRAKRDLSEAAFRRALERNGFRRDGDLHFVDASGNRFEAICQPDPIRIARRATLAKILRARSQKKGMTADGLNALWSQFIDDYDDGTMSDDMRARARFGFYSGVIAAIALLERQAGSPETIPATIAKLRTEFAAYLTTGSA